MQLNSLLAHQGWIAAKILFSSLSTGIDQPPPDGSMPSTGLKTMTCPSDSESKSKYGLKVEISVKLNQLCALQTGFGGSRNWKGTPAHTGRPATNIPMPFKVWKGIEWPSHSKSKTKSSLKISVSKRLDVFMHSEDRYYGGPHSSQSSFFTFPEDAEHL